MKLKSIIITALALIGFAGNANADTTKLTTADGWTKITTVPTSTDIANNYYVFVDATRDLMLGIGKGEQNTKAWYSLALYYHTSVEPTSKDITQFVWTLESNNGGFSMRNLDQPVHVFQTEYNAAWYFDTNDVTSSNEWSKVNLALSDGKFTLENGKYTGNYIGPWNDNNFTDGAECAANKTTALRGYFHIYAISRAQFKQNLLDNASSSNPVDLTPWYVSNATFDGGNRTGWTEEGSGGNNNTQSRGGGCEIWHRSNFKIYQDLTVPNGKYKVSLQIAGGSVGDGQVYGTSGSTTKTVTSSATAGSDFQNTILSMIQDRTYGKVLTDEIEVSNGAIQMGMQCSTSDQWIVFDNFKLYCTGVDLSAYETQLSDLVDECNTFISSGVVPEVCESAISYAIDTYNQSYSTAKEYSNAIVALTAVLDTYRNDTELQNAYASFNSFKTKVVDLTTGQTSSTELTTFNNRVSTSTSTVEAAADASTINAEIPNLRSAALTYISSVEGQFDITFLASQNYWEWKKKDGSNAGIVADQYLTNRPNTIPSFAESYETTCATTGTVLYQTIEDMPAGYYQVGMYAAAMFTSGRGFDTEATEGDANRTYAFAGNLNDASSILRTGSPIAFATSRDFDELTTLDVNVHLSSEGDLTFGVQKDANGSNWHFAQIMSIVYSNAPDLTQLKATRDALVAEAQGLLNGSADYLTTAQQAALQDAITAGNNANDFDALNTVTLTTLPNAINTAKQQVQQAKAAVPAMLAALERFENDYNLQDGTDYRRVNMSAKAWTDLLDKVNAVSTALDDISQASSYATTAKALTDQMDATDASLRLFKSYKAMVDGTQSFSIAEGTTYAVNSYMDTDETQQTAIAALNTAFDNYAATQTGNFDVSAFLGSNLDFSEAAGSVINGENSNTIKNVTGWEVEYADADTWAVIQTDQAQNNGKLYMRKNWGSSATTLEVFKEKMLPVGKYQLSLKWNSDMANMTNLSAYVINGTSTSIGENTNNTLTYDFEISGSAQPFDLIIGFQKTGTDNTPAQIVVDDIVLTYTPTLVTLYDKGGDAANNATTISTYDEKRCVVTLQGRTLYKDGKWNTLCLPFNMTAAQVTSILAPAENGLMELDTEAGSYAHITGFEDGTLYLNFKSATSITAGKPYIIKWASGTDVIDPKFPGVIISNVTTTSQGVTSEDGYVQFQGTYRPVTYDAENKSVLFMGGNSKLYYPADNTSITIGAFRSYFQLNGITAGTPNSLVKAFVLNFDGDSADGLKDLMDSTGLNDVIYNLAGQRLNKMQKGINIINGKKVLK